jgi:hypothetical protein
MPAPVRALLINRAAPEVSDTEAFGPVVLTAPAMRPLPAPPG